MKKSSIPYAQLENADHVFSLLPFPFLPFPSLHFTSLPFPSLPFTSPINPSGYWKLLYTDFDPPAESSGKVGPFVGDVYQALSKSSADKKFEGEIKNILQVSLPPVKGSINFINCYKYRICCNIITDTDATSIITLLHTNTSAICR